MIEGPNKELAERMVQEWNSAELAIKLTEQSTGDLVLPAIAELRYAGRQVVEFISRELQGDDDPEISRSYLNDAIADVLRAKHDAVDVMVAKASEDLRTAIAGRDKKEFPELADDIEIIRRVKSKIAETRANRASRNEVYQSILDDDLMNLFEITERYRYLGAFRIENDNTSKRWSVLKETSAVYVALGGAVSAILGMLIALLGI